MQHTRTFTKKLQLIEEKQAEELHGLDLQRVRENENVVSHISFSSTGPSVPA
jgi:hypothetical protein